MKAELTVIVGIEVPLGTNLDELCLGGFTAVIVDTKGREVKGASIIRHETTDVCPEEDFVIQEKNVSE